MKRTLEVYWRFYVLSKIYTKIALYYLKKRSKHVKDFSNNKWWYYNNKFRYWHNKACTNFDVTYKLAD